MRRRRVLFFAKCPMNYVLFRPVHERLARDERIRFHFTGKFRGRSDPKKVFEGFDLMGGRLLRNSIARFLPWDLYVSPDFRLAGKRARMKIHMFHGFSIRNFAIHERALRFDRLFLIGPYMKRRFVESGLVAEDDARLREVGMPKLDALVRGEYRRDDVLARLGLDPERPTVLFAPTWIRGGCLDTQGEEIVRRLRAMDVNTIVKLHDNSFDVRKQRVDWGEVIEGLLGERQRLVRDPDATPLLAAADVLVSDASSIANEFLLLDRPLVFFRLEHLERDWPSTDRKTWGTRTGFVVDRAEELPGAIERALAEPDLHAEIRRAAARDFFYAPGEATDRAVAELLAALELPAEASGA